MLGSNDKRTNSNLMETGMTEKLYTLAEVAAELDCGTKELRRRLNGSVVRDENLMRCVPGSVVRSLIEDRDSALAAERDRERRRRENPAPNPSRERVRAIQAAQRANPIGLGADMTMDQRALGTVTASEIASGIDERVAASSQRIDDFMSGEIRVRRFGRKARGENSSPDRAGSCPKWGT